MKNGKVLFIADHLRGGGAERILLEVAEGLSNTHEVIIALMDSTHIRMQIPSKIKSIDLNVSKKFMTGSLWRRGNRRLNNTEIKQINDLIEKEKPSLIILSHWYAFHYAPHIQGNVHIWVHSDIFDPIKKKTSNLFRWYKETRRVIYERKYFPKLLDGKNLIVVNQDLKTNYQPFIPNTKISVIYNGINLNKSQSDKISHTKSEKKWDCVFVGRLSPEKQPDYALRAFAKSHLTGRMAFIGDGDELSSLIQIASKLGISDRIDFLGWQEDVPSYICQSNLLIMSSKAEGFGLVIAEALSLNVPVAAFNCSEGVNFQLNTPRLKLGLVEAQNISALADKIDELYNKPYPITLDDIAHLSIERMIQDFKQLI